MKTYYFYIAGGNLTALVIGAPNKARNAAIKRLMKRAEQVGFLNRKTKILEMMGGELCINATLAAARLLGGSGRLSTAGVNVLYKNEKNITTIQISIKPERPQNDTVLLETIGYIFTDKHLSKTYLAKLAQIYEMPAFGNVVVKNGSISPRVYVRDVDSCVDETACGSGSVATYLRTGINQIIQPSGGTISVVKFKGEFKISTEVREVKL